MRSDFLLVITVIIILIVFGVFLITFLMLHNKKMVQNKEIIRDLELEKARKNLVNAIEIQEIERSRLGADLHDDLGPTLSTMKLKINSLKTDMPLGEKSKEQLKSIVNETIKQVRSLSHSLHPNTLEKYGLKAALAELGTRVESATNIKVKQQVDVSIDELPFYAQINIYRIIQEYVNNALKHSKCENLEVAIKKDTGDFIIKINDDGVGFDVSSHYDGLGMKTMRMRAEVINYDLMLTSKIGKGTEVVLTKNEDV